MSLYKKFKVDTTDEKYFMFIKFFSLQKYGGISRYFTQIILNLQENIQTELAIKYSE
jgi:hypothetical protein